MDTTTEVKVRITPSPPREKEPCLWPDVGRRCGLMHEANTVYDQRLIFPSENMRKVMEALVENCMFAS